MNDSTPNKNAPLCRKTPQTLPEWLHYLESLHPKGEAGIELGLERVRAVAERLGQRPFCPILTVGGTNGKGSTAAYLESILHCAHYRVGCYSSPHLLAYNERIKISGVPIDDAALIAAFERVEAARGEIPLTYFEFGTLAAWEAFAQAGCEALVLEVGLGGRLDAVNLYDADVALVTTVDLDHTAWLGADREAIGFEKAGIFRAGKPALFGDANPPDSLVAHARQIGAAFECLGHDFFARPDDAHPLQWHYRHGPIRRTLAYPGLRGKTQLKNAALALAALDCLADDLPMSMQAVRDGLIRAELPGRFQVLPGQPSIVLDIAHNPQAVRTLAQNLLTQGFFERTVAVLGMLADKDAAEALKPLSGRITHWHLAPLPGPRGQSAETLAEKLQATDPEASFTCHASLKAALDAALSCLAPEDRLIVFGSFLTVAEALKALGRI
jgi:dihydrofolate synthase/folylpolyglutamate synthase